MTIATPILEATTHAPMSLAVRLHDALQRHAVAYCQWKGHASPERWVRGDGDLDLLVTRSDAGRLANALSEVGLKLVVPPPAKQIPGTASYYGLYAELDRFVHVHVHYHLRLGNYRTMNYHLPIEAAILASSVPGSPLRVPAPEPEFVVFVLRMVLAYSPVAALMRREDLASPKRTADWEHFASRVTHSGVREFLRAHLPGLSPELFDRCVRSLSPGGSAMTRLRVKRQLARVVRSRRAGLADALLRLRYAIAERIARLGGRRRYRNRLATGGLVLAVLGGDGAGKTTAVKDLRAWLGRSFHTTSIHLGKPPRSLATLMVGLLRRLTVAVGMGAHAGPILALRAVCVARDRYRLYMRACRQAAAGSIVICDRYPTTFIRTMDGPAIGSAAMGRSSGWAIRILERCERAYYDRILPPDLAILLKVDPDLAVARKVDEPPEYVRARARAIWELNLDGAFARVVDASRSRAEVVADLRSLVWSQL